MSKAGWRRFMKSFSCRLQKAPTGGLRQARLQLRTRAFFEALRRGLLNNDELEKASNDLEAWLQKDQKRFNEEQKRELASSKKK